MRLLPVLAAAALAACAGTAPPGAPAAPAQAPPQAPSVRREPWGVAPGGQAVELFTLASGRGMEVRLASYAGAIVSLRVPDRDGRAADVVLGFDSLAGYLADRSQQGALVGRFANRIARGRFRLDGRAYTLALNNPPHHLHGGPGGFHRVVWRGEPFRHDSAVGVVFRRRSPHGEEGYPGNLDVRVTYTLTAGHDLRVEYRAVTDRPTPVNLTQHAYFNLAGDGDVRGHELQVHASRFTPVDSTLIPTGELAPVQGTPLDLRRPARLGERIAAHHAQKPAGRGFDHNWVLDRGGPGLVPAARLRHPASGRVLEVLTTEPGMQVYTANWLATRGRGGRAYGRFAGVALETQHFPDSPNQPAFPSTVLRPGQELRSETVFRFRVE